MLVAVLLFVLFESVSWEFVDNAWRGRLRGIGHVRVKEAWLALVQLRTSLRGCDAYLRRVTEDLGRTSLT